MCAKCQKKAVPREVPPVAGQKRKRPTFLSMDQTQVEIIVGKEAKTFMVYKELVCFHSEYFRGAFEGSFRESEDKSIRLEDVTEPTFRLFQVWLYAQATREVVGSSARSRAVAWEVPKGLRLTRLSSKNTYYDLFVELYIFADQYDVPQLRTDIMTVLVAFDRYLNKAGKGPLSVIAFASPQCERLPQTAGIRVYIARRAAITWHRPVPDRTAFERYGKEFVNDVLQEMLSVPRDTSASKWLHSVLLHPCHYHQHNMEEERVQCENHQIADHTFHMSFLRACLNEVCMIEDEEPPVPTTL